MWFGWSIQVSNVLFDLHLLNSAWKAKFQTPKLTSAIQAGAMAY